MGKKTTLFGRKKARALAHGIKASDPRFAAFETLVRSRPLDEAPALDFMPDVRPVATKAIEVTQAALEDLLAHRIEPSNGYLFDQLASAIDVAHIRYLEIQPSEDNPAHQPLLEAKAILQSVRERRQRLGTWGLAGPEREPLAYAISLYAQVLKVSSQEQMDHAAKLRWDALRKGQTWAAIQSRREAETT